MAASNRRVDMKVTEQDLRERYETLETRELLELQAQGTLTETAARVLEQVLADRAIPAGERATVTAEIEAEANARDEQLAALASRGARLGAQLIDFMVVVAILFMSAMFGLAAPALAVLGFLVAFAYLLLADGLPRGQSFGKRVLNIAVIDRRTRAPCTYGQSFLRNFLLAVLGIIDWIFIFGATHQRLGDMAANTIVVRLESTTAA
jgi:uncharacterized RDD family membrane protein YckC